MQKQNGTSIVTIAYEVAPGGDTLATVTTVLASGQEIKMVYDRE